MAKSLGKVGIKDMLELTPERLAQQQEDALREHVVEKLRHIANLIKGGHYDKVEQMLAFSSAGDDFGNENYYIDFSETGLDDIGGVVNKLGDLNLSRQVGS